MTGSGAALTVGLDVGGTKTAGGVVDPDGRVLALTTADTPAADPTRLRGVVIDMIRELAAAYPVTAVGIGVAGWIDAGRDTVRFAPHLPWRDEPLRDRVAAAVGLPVVVENDANAAAWAEYVFGAGRDAGDPMVLVTVGTGIGGGVVLGGRLVRGYHGYAGEFGHQAAVPDGVPCPCGRRGCLERYASGEALVGFARAGAAEDPAAATALRELAARGRGGGAGDRTGAAGGRSEGGDGDGGDGDGGDGDGGDGDGGGITGPLVTTAARAGDKVARQAFDQVGWWLGQGLADLVQVLDPRLLVVGGGVAEAGELLLAPVREAYRQALAGRSPLPAAQVRAARLGTVAGLVGAAELARGG